MKYEVKKHGKGMSFDELASGTVICIKAKPQFSDGYDNAFYAIYINDEYGESDPCIFDLGNNALYSDLEHYDIIEVFEDSMLTIA
jgi:hypothetical protein